MLVGLARNWGWLLFRAVLAALYGLVVLLLPHLSLITFVYLFGIYALVDGIVMLAVAVDVRGLLGFGSLLVEAFLRTGGGLFAMSSSAVLATFPRYFAGWAILTGIAESFVAVVLRRDLAAEWPLPFASFVSVVVAIALLATPGQIGVPALRWLVGPYALIVSGTLLALTRRLRQIAHEMEAV
jgi:uncharacterized membrane protein HdeD (DUF308 family)